MYVVEEEIAEVKLTLDYYSGVDTYSDGSVEDDILHIVQNTDDYEQVLEYDQRWAVVYHLSHIRKNILSWYPFKSNANLLEIGAGCGAITSLFTEKLNRVFAVELSKQRSLINAQRNRHANNLEIIVGNLSDIQFKEKFDYITLIGVLEYAGIYNSSAEEPFSNFLQTIKKYLKPDGRLLVAIENRLGAKYLSGSPEDHTGILFDGIDNYPSNRGIKTFSKSEWSDLASMAGLKINQFYYPYPDYKFPEVIFSDERLPLANELPFRGYLDQSHYQMQDVNKFQQSLLAEGVFDIFSNSFLLDLSINK